MEILEQPDLLGPKFLLGQNTRSSSHPFMGSTRTKKEKFIGKMFEKTAALGGDRESKEFSVNETRLSVTTGDSEGKQVEYNKNHKLFTSKILTQLSAPHEASCMLGQVSVLSAFLHDKRCTAET